MGLMGLQCLEGGKWVIKDFRGSSRPHKENRVDEPPAVLSCLSMGSAGSWQMVEGAPRTPKGWACSQQAVAGPPERLGGRPGAVSDQGLPHMRWAWSTAGGSLLWAGNST